MNIQFLTHQSKTNRFIFQHLLPGLDHPWRSRINNPEKLVQAAGIKLGQTVLEVGCGSGFFTESASALVGEHGRLHAIDVHPLAVEATVKKVQERKFRNVFVTCADAHATNFTDGFFDVILLYGVIPAPGIIDVHRLIPEMHRILKPGGILAVWTAVPFWSPKSLTASHLLMYIGKHDGVHQFKK
jgi:ubiquinone/menaquinone biosynthesis C-methylase UbiE